ncbi:tetratricopeptide repeat protein [bacterium]|nr:MAG: tetratricopeptide repeat protein [bacterium]
MSPKFIKGLQILLLCLLLSLPINTKALALDHKAKSALSHYIMGVMYDDLGQIDQAIQEYKKSLRFDSGNALVHFNLAVSYLKNSQLTKAEEEFKSAVKLDPDAVEPHALLALLYSSQHKIELATLEYEIALKNASRLEPKNVDIYKGLGMIYLRQKKFEAAKKTYQLILSFAPLDPEVHFYLGSTYNELKDKDAAVRQLRKALELKSDYADALNYLGYLYVEDNHNFDKAEAMIKKALEIEPDNGAYVDSLGWLYFKKGRLKEAVKELSRASGLMEDSVIYDHLGDTYFKLGDIDKAKLNWQKALKLDPNPDKIKTKLGNIK